MNHKSGYGKRYEVTPFLNAEHLKYVKDPYDVSLLVPKDTNMQTNKLVLGDF